MTLSGRWGSHSGVTDEVHTLRGEVLEAAGGGERAGELLSRMHDLAYWEAALIWLPEYIQYSAASCLATALSTKHDRRGPSDCGGEKEWGGHYSPALCRANLSGQQWLQFCSATTAFIVHTPAFQLQRRTGTDGN